MSKKMTMQALTDKYQTKPPMTKPRGRPRKQADTVSSPKKPTRQEKQAQRLKADMAWLQKKPPAQPAKATPNTAVGLSARELQAMRNAEYFRKVAAGEIKDLPFPNDMRCLVLRDDALGDAL